MPVLKSGNGVSQAQARLETLGAGIDQVGDREVGATVPVERIEEVLNLIRVSKLRPGDASLESHSIALRLPFLP